jgi:hypothetical protein
MQAAAVSSSTKAFELTERRWDTPTAIRIAGCEQATLLQWRRKYGFLGGSEPGRGRVGYKYSVVEIIELCAAVAMVQHGLPPADACSMPFLRAHVEALIEGRVESQFLAFHRGGATKNVRVSFYFLGASQTVGEVVQDTIGGILTILDLQRIIDRVLKKLRLRVLTEATPDDNRPAKPIEIPRRRRAT